MWSTLRAKVLKLSQLHKLRQFDNNSNQCIISNMIKTWCIKMTVATAFNNKYHCTSKDKSFWEIFSSVNTIFVMFSTHFTTSSMIKTCCLKLTIAADCNTTHQCTSKNKNGPAHFVATAKPFS